MRSPRMVRRRMLTLSLAIAASAVAAGRAGADMILTPAATAAGFQISVFASGFPTDSSERNGTAGPLGMAFLSNGGVLVTDAPGNVRLFTTDADGQLASSAGPVQSLGHNNAAGLAQFGDTIYMNEQSAGRVVQLNADGTFNQLIVNLPTPTGIVADPFTGHLFVSTDPSNTIYDVNPATKTATPFLTVANPDGLSLSPDGKTLYVAAVGAGGGGHILGFDTTTKAQVFDSGAINGVDGTALGVGPLAGNIFANTNSGQLVEVNLTTGAQTPFGTNGTRGDFVAVDPNNGSLLLTQTDRILRISGFIASVPEPGSVILLGTGLLGLFGLLRRRAATPR